MFYYFRYDVNADNYTSLNSCKNVATLTSALKLFLREMKQPLIPKEITKRVKSEKIELGGKYDEKKLIKQLKNVFDRLDPLSYHVLHYLLLHLKRVLDIEGRERNYVS